jgi:hypothetical protein
MEGQCYPSEPEASSEPSLPKVDFPSRQLGAVRLSRLAPQLAALLGDSDRKGNDELAREGRVREPEREGREHVRFRPGVGARPTASATTVLSAPPTSAQRTMVSPPGARAVPNSTSMGIPSASAKDTESTGMSASSCAENEVRLHAAPREGRWQIPFLPSPTPRSVSTVSETKRSPSWESSATTGEATPGLDPPRARARSHPGRNRRALGQSPPRRRVRCGSGSAA